MTNPLIRRNYRSLWPYIGQILGEDTIRKLVVYSPKTLMVDTRLKSIGAIEQVVSSRCYTNTRWLITAEIKRLK